MLNRRVLLKSGIGIPALSVSWAKHQGVRGFALESIDDDCGVASGDPKHDKVVLWTRIPAKARKGLGDAHMLLVRYEVALSPNFDAKSLIQAGEVETGGFRDYTVKIRIQGLEPFTTYYYRFLVGSDYVSVTGRTKTLPAPGDTTNIVKFAYVSCQRYSDGYYSVYAQLAKEDVDFCIHLGDHIYEQEKGRHGSGDPLQGRVAKTLEDFRAKWRYYLTDPNWREVRRLFPWIDLWDDHEIFNDYAGERDRHQQAARLAAGYQAFDEYIPHFGEFILSPEGVPHLQIYRNFTLGNLVELIVTDERQYRTPTLCLGTYATRPCSSAHRSEHTMLGVQQKTWFKETLGNSGAKWKIHASQVMMGPMRLINHVKGNRAQDHEKIAQTMFAGQMIEDRGVYLTLDQWDGYPAERQELFSYIHDSKIKNYTVITGDIHSAFQGELRLDPIRCQGPVIGCELVTTAVSSETNGRALGALAGLATWLVRRSNPDIKWSDIVNNGYTVLNITQEGIDIRHMAVNSVWSPNSDAFIARKAKILSNTPGFA